MGTCLTSLVIKSRLLEQKIAELRALGKAAEAQAIEEAIADQSRQRRLGKLNKDLAIAAGAVGVSVQSQPG